MQIEIEDEVERIFYNSAACVERMKQLLVVHARGIQFLEYRRKMSFWLFFLLGFV